MSQSIMPQSLISKSEWRSALYSSSLHLRVHRELLKELWIVLKLLLNLYNTLAYLTQPRTIAAVYELTISNPPTSSPCTYNCGNVGHSENSFNPCLTSSSARILKNPYRTPFSRSKPTVCREKPHCGAEGVPFMKSITFAAFVRVLRRVLRSSSSGGGAPFV